MTKKEYEFIEKKAAALGYLEKEHEAAPGIPVESFAGQMIQLKQCWEVFKWTFLFEYKILKIKGDVK